MIGSCLIEYLKTSSFANRWTTTLVIPIGFLFFGGSEMVLLGCRLQKTEKNYWWKRLEWLL